jgi:hypothetical protein
MEFWDREEAVVICDSADHDNGLVFVGICGVLGCCFRDDTRKRHGWTVDAGHEKAAENDLIEVRIGSAYNNNLVSWGLSSLAPEAGGRIDLPENYTYGRGSGRVSPRA